MQVKFKMVSRWFKKKKSIAIKIIEKIRDDYKEKKTSASIIKVYEKDVDKLIEMMPKEIYEKFISYDEVYRLEHFKFGIWYQEIMIQIYRKNTKVKWTYIKNKESFFFFYVILRHVYCLLQNFFNKK